MQRHTRQLLWASLLALYGLVTACGPALHSLPGADHAKYESPEKWHGSEHPTSPHDDCPLCHFLAQGQIAAESAAILSIDAVRIQPADDLPITCPPSIDRPCAPRAPPYA